MKLQLIYLIFFLICFQHAFAQEPIREEIYTLTSNEVVAYEENSLGLYQDELGYIVVTADVKQFTRNYHIKGKIYGPFDRRLVEKPVFNLSSWGFIDSKKETSHVLFNGKEIGIHKDPLYPVGLKVAKKSWAYVLIDQLEGSTKVVINGQELGPYSSLLNYYLSSDGSRWAIAYGDNPDEYYVLFNNGKKIGPYKNIIDFEFLEGKNNSRWVLTAEPKTLLAKNVNGKEISQFVVVTNTGEIGTFETERYGFPPFDYKNLITKGANYGINVLQNQKLYYLANDKLYGPYQNPVASVDFGEDYNKFNYIVPETRNLHFTGDGIFSRNVDKYFVSESRKTVAVIKKAIANRDSLFMNDKYFKGIFNKIATLKFAPASETWALLSDNGDGTYQLHFSDGRKFGPYNIDISQNMPTIILGKDCKNWAFYYVEDGTGKTKLLVNNQERNEEFIGNISFVKEDGKEYFSWFSLNDKTVNLNKLLLQ